MAGFQKQVGMYMAPAVDGAWASYNPYYSLLEPSNGDLASSNSVSWKVGAGGVVVGRFAFCNDETGEATAACPFGVITNSDTAGTIRVGFVQRAQQVVITEFLGAANLGLYEGQGVTLISEGDVWARFANAPVAGHFVYASVVDGSCLSSASKTVAPYVEFTATTVNGNAALTVADPSKLSINMLVSGDGIADDSRIIGISGTSVTLNNAPAVDGSNVTLRANVAVLTRYRVVSSADAGELAKISVGAY